MGHIPCFWARKKTIQWQPAPHIFCKEFQAWDAKCAYLCWLLCSVFNACACSDKSLVHFERIQSAGQFLMHLTGGFSIACNSLDERRPIICLLFIYFFSAD
jgi:hypothetical protein